MIKPNTEITKVGTDSFTTAFGYDGNTSIHLSVEQTFMEDDEPGMKNLVIEVSGRLNTDSTTKTVIWGIDGDQIDNLIANLMKIKSIL